MALFKINKNTMVIKDVKEAFSLLDAMTDFAKEKGISLNDLQCCHTAYTNLDPSLEENTYSPLFLFMHTNYDYKGDFNEDHRWTLIEELAKRGLDVNQVKADEEPAIHDAASYRDWDRVMGFVKLGANINVQKASGDTVLHRWLKLMHDQRVFNPDVEVPKQLVRMGADPRIKNNQGETAYDIAKNTYNIERTDLPDFLKEISLVLDEKEALGAASLITKSFGAANQSIMSSVSSSTTVRL